MSDTITLPNLTIDREALAGFCRRHRIKKLTFFGSVLRNDFRPDSDIDVLVEFRPGTAVTYFALARMERELSALCGGRKVDLVTPNALHPLIRERVRATARVEYVDPR
ncbi:nucleotidyltransferase family protein [Caldinitratiruptor microaerophilus]|uniref:Nucleotidyltransferase n=1 Tax=Caldinitratiruptor microaerophilus TaxID=671077 RepID=A0AA35CJX9_9FIRM|nr:nucleotidyltransferase family protein [Caldinitratiruptor microaerophilus]BDG59753.1 nucleotidyltransferase [Caldinitratiruptor microaerophilus]